MKNLSLILNVVLLALVGVLFAFYFSLKKSIAGNGGQQLTGASFGNTRLLRIAFVNADSINSGYALMADFRKEIQQRQAVLQNEYDVKAKNLQDEYVLYQQRVQANNISQVDAEKEQNKMQGKKSELDELQHRQQELMNEVQERNLKLQLKIQDYIVSYNKKMHFDYILAYAGVAGSVLYANDSLNLTKQVLAGLNARYKDSLQKTSIKPR